MSIIIDEVKDLYRVIQFKEFRKTEGVTFDIIPVKSLGHIDAVDRVLHVHSAVSPSKVGDVLKPWYMHSHQEDNLVVLAGTRYVEIYTPQHGKIERFTVTADSVYKGDELIYEGGAMLVWPRRVFHRIVSGKKGSASINLAIHYEGFDIKTNFNIFDVDIKSGEYKVIREGFKDQF
jgi:hypothetical protein